MRMFVFLAGVVILGCSNPLGAVRPEAPGPAPARDAPGGGRADRPTNFLVIVADDLGTDKVGVYREHQKTPSTPNIDALAGEGVLFRNAYTYAVCSATRAALLTGRYGRRNGMGGIVELDHSTHELPLDEVLIPEALARGGQTWHSAALGKWHLSGFRTPSGFRHPLLQGFDHHIGSLGNLGNTSKKYGQRATYEHYEKGVDGKPEWSTTYVTTDTTNDATHQLKTLAEPWFMWVAYNAPHDPFHAPPAELVARRPAPDASAPELHAAMVESLDREIGRLIGAMTKEQRASTMIVFIGDNGTSGDAVLAPLEARHGKGSLYEGGTNVPLIIAGPGVGKSGAEADALVHAVDLLPTVVEMAGGSTSGLVLDGMSFASVIADPKKSGPRQTVYTERFTPIGPGPYDIDMIAIRDTRYKLLRTKKGDLQFFDLNGRNDDGPSTAPKDLTGEPRERFESLKRELERISTTVKYAY